MKENWKDIKGYEGLYQVSDMGRVKSLERWRSNGYSGYIQKEKILKISYNEVGYAKIGLSKNGVYKRYSVHQLMAISFLGHKINGMKKVVDHINNIKYDNRLQNLQVITSRENSSKDRRGYTSKYVGVSWDKNNRNWRAMIYMNGKQTHIGSFVDEEEANLAYQKKLKEITQ